MLSKTKELVENEYRCLLKNDSYQLAFPQNRRYFKAPKDFLHISDFDQLKYGFKDILPKNAFNKLWNQNPAKTSTNLHDNSNSRTSLKNKLFDKSNLFQDCKNNHKKSLFNLKDKQDQPMKEEKTALLTDKSNIKQKKNFRKKRKRIKFLKKTKMAKTKDSEEITEKKTGTLSSDLIELPSNKILQNYISKSILCLKNVNSKFRKKVKSKFHKSCFKKCQTSLDADLKNDQKIVEDYYHKIEKDEHLKGSLKNLCNNMKKKIKKEKFHKKKIKRKNILQAVQRKIQKQNIERQKIIQLYQDKFQKGHPMHNNDEKIQQIFKYGSLNIISLIQEINDHKKEECDGVSLITQTQEISDELQGQYYQSAEARKAKINKNNSYSSNTVTVQNCQSNKQTNKNEEMKQVEENIQKRTVSLNEIIEQTYSINDKDYSLRSIIEDHHEKIDSIMSTIEDHDKQKYKFEFNASSFLTKFHFYYGIRQKLREKECIKEQTIKEQTVNEQTINEQKHANKITMLASYSTSKFIRHSTIEQNLREQGRIKEQKEDQIAQVVKKKILADRARKRRKIKRDFLIARKIVITYFLDYFKLNSKENEDNDIIKAINEAEQDILLRPVIKRLIVPIPIRKTIQRPPIRKSIKKPPIRNTILPDKSGQKNGQYKTFQQECFVSMGFKENLP